MLEFAEGVPKHVGSGGQSGSRSMCQAVEFPHFSVLGYKPFAYFGSKRGVYFFFFFYFQMLELCLILLLQIFIYNAKHSHWTHSLYPHNYWFCSVHYSIKLATSPAGIVWSAKLGTRNSDTSS